MSIISSMRSAVIAALLAPIVSMFGSALSPAEAQSRWGKDYFPNLPVVNQDGKELHFYDDLIKGKIVVFSFIYTSCRDICPLVTARLAQVQERLGDAVGRDIHFVSVSIDPENDTPAKLKEHAEAFRVAPGWQFVTGRPEDIRLIRHKLGERSRTLTEHRNEIVLGNDVTGDWARDSAFSDINVLTLTIRSMDPAFRHSAARKQSVDTSAVVLDSDILPGQALFAKACAGCHTVGGGTRIGPDLNNVMNRRERGWVSSFIMAPEQMRARKDPIAMELVSQFKNVRMPTLGLSDADAADVIAYLEFQTYRLTAQAEQSAAPHVHATDAHQHHHH